MKCEFKLIKLENNIMMVLTRFHIHFSAHKFQITILFIFSKNIAFVRK